MDKIYSKDKILSKAKSIAKMISETEEVELFKQAESQVNNSIKVQHLISQIKRMQKEAVNLQHYGKFEALKKAEQEIATLQTELDGIPVVKQFKQSQLDVNELLQIVATTISTTVTNEMEKATGGEILQGTTKKRDTK
ncbi:RicAFT regulatory complex protein RicA family protein [Anaerobacillus alkalilacustris]|nr:YlbF family regulator [Anaerobacillus alkalilacustris]